jgi:hypothetical protein
MGFHWYIDVDEPGQSKSFSAGPIILSDGETMNVPAFVQKVNQAFLNVYENGTHDLLYVISARLLPLSGQSTAGSPGGVPAGQHLHISTGDHAQVHSGTPFIHDSHDSGDQTGIIYSIDGNITGEHTHTQTSTSPLLSWPTTQQLAAYNTANPGNNITANTLQYTEALSSRQFVVQYRIKNQTNRPFILKFFSGAHGQTPITDILGSVAGEQDGFPPRARVTVTNTSNVQPLVMDHCKITAMITDKPPVPPDMWFVPYRGVNDRMLILFSPNIGRRIAKPILLATSDSTFIIEEYYSQKDLIVDPANIGAIEETLEYASDDPTRTYQIFRMDTMPTSYSSFIDHHLATVEEQLSPQKFSTGVSHLDTLLPNVKYYYCGRSIDRHRNISNPTPITELELVDNNGQLYVNKKIFTFPTIPQRPTKSGRRLLAIEPSQLQQAYSLENPRVGDGQAVVGTAPPSNLIGAAADSVWDKKFKIRLTSQKTGKKMDLNITFKNTGVANP